MVVGGICVLVLATGRRIFGAQHGDELPTIDIELLQMSKSNIEQSRHGLAMDSWYY